MNVCYPIHEEGAGVIKVCWSKDVALMLCVEHNSNYYSSSWPRWFVGHSIPLDTRKTAQEYDCE